MTHHPSRRPLVLRLTWLLLVLVVCTQRFFPLHVAGRSTPQIEGSYGEAISEEELKKQEQQKPYCVVLPEPVSPTMTTTWFSVN